MKSSTIAILFTLGGAAVYLYFVNKEQEEAKGIDGLEIRINPQRIIDGALAISDIHPLAKDGIRRIAENAMKKYYED
jgi:hypothetical protein